MQNQNYVNAFNSFDDMIDLEVCHTGTVGTVQVTTAAEYYEVDEHGANEDWANWLDSEGLDQVCSLEDALEGTFPDKEVQVSLSIELSSENASVQQGDAVRELKSILQGMINKLDRLNSYEACLHEKAKDTNGNSIGHYSVVIEEA